MKKTRYEQDRYVGVRGILAAAILFVVFAFMAASLCGCETTRQFVTRLNPTTAETIENVGETATGVLSILSLFIPGLAGVAGAATAGVATYKKMKPTLTTNKTVSEHVVSSLETLKEEDNELWQKVKTYLEKHTDADIEAATEAVINTVKEV